MAWTAPMTAVSGVIWTSAQFNSNVRDNLLETFPGKATAGNRMYVSNGLNSVAERVPSNATVATTETTTSTTYAALTTPGPSVTVTTGTKAVVWILTRAQHATSGAEMSASVEVSSATTIAASDEWRWLQSGVTSANPNRFMVCHLFSNLNTGSNVFTMKYKTNTGTATFLHRELIVLPL